MGATPTDHTPRYEDPMRNGAGGDPKSGSSGGGRISGGGRVRTAVQRVIRGGGTVGESTILQEQARNTREAQSQVQIAEGKNVRVKETSREARREAMRMQGIPTSSQPEPGGQSKNESGRSYDYKVPKSGGGTERKSVQDQTKDRNHDKPHWEAGKVRTDRNGNVKMNNYNRPKLDNNKSKVEYNRK